MDGQMTAPPAARCESETGRRGAASYHPELVPQPEVRVALVAELMRSDTLGIALGGYMRKEAPAVTAEGAKRQTPNWVNKKQRTVLAVFEGRLPNGPTCRKAICSDLNGILARAKDPLVIEHVRRVLRALGAERVVLDAGGSAKDIPVGCVYVLVTPTDYQLRPVVKIGCRRSSTDPAGRIAALRMTASAEGVLQARRFLARPGSNGPELERELHMVFREKNAKAHLKGGAEWFLCSLEEVDGAAASLGARSMPTPDVQAVEALAHTPSRLLRMCGLTLEDLAAARRTNRPPVGEADAHGTTESGTILDEGRSGEQGEPSWH